jgi:hypothetical protein
MPLDLIYSWVAAGSMVAVLAVMGVRNRRSGWKSERSDVVLDILMLWAKVVGQSDASSQPTTAAVTKETPASPGVMTSDLAALGMALGKSSVPAGIPVSGVASEEPVPTTAGQTTADR